ncbi:MAG: TrkH family potassium uptake protein [bacterium]
MKPPELPGDRQAGFRRERLAAFGFSSGLLTLSFGLVTLVPLLLLLAFPQERALAPAFWLPGGASVAFGLALLVTCRRGRRYALNLTDGAAIVTAIWLYAGLVGSVPFIIGARAHFLHGLFESVSGITTTGLSVFDVRGLPQLLLFWRSWLQFLGGAGFAIVMLAAIVGPFAPALSVAEGHSDPLLPHVRKSAGMFMFLYAGYSAAGIAAYVLAGMAPFEAVCHAFSALSTGGFSTRAGSIGEFGNAGIELITIALMLAGATSFTLHHALWRGRVRAVGRNGELRLAGVVLAGSFLLVAVGTVGRLGLGFVDSARVALFETASALTTTGYSITGYAPWNGLGIFVLIILMTVGGAVSSTAGGVKQYRVYLLFKSVVWDIRRRFLPRNAVVHYSVWRGGTQATIVDQDLRRVAGFVFLYLATYVAGVLVLLGAGCSVQEALFEFASALATTGLSVGVTGPGTAPAILWAEIGGMFLGRLEFLVVLVGLVRVGRGLADYLRRRNRRRVEPRPGPAPSPDEGEV